MKKIFKFLFGDVGVILIAIIMAVISWYLFPIFIDICQGSHPLSNIIGWLFICPFALGFYISGIVNTISLTIKTLLNKDYSQFTKWTLFAISILLLIYYVAILGLSLVF